MVGRVSLRPVSRRPIRRIVAAPDKFKGTLRAADVAAAIGHACWELGIDCTEVPMADGGDGLLDALGVNALEPADGPLEDLVAAASAVLVDMTAASAVGVEEALIAPTATPL
jgi:glycerate kinase